MSLPLTRNRTYTAGTVADPGDLNDFQDAIVGKKHGLIREQLQISGGFDVASGPFFTNGRWTLGAGDLLQLSIPIPVGNVLERVDLFVDENTALTATLYEMNAATFTDTAIGATVAGSGGYETIGWTALAYAIVTQKFIRLSVTGNGSDYLYGVEYEHYRP